MRWLALLLALSACPPSPPTSKARLVTYCSSSAECQHNTDGCTFCLNARCSCTLPAEPNPGADVAPGGTTP